MPILNRIAKVVAKPVPRVLSPRAHAAVDYIRIGVYVASAGWFWRRNKRATIAALVCATAETALNLITDYDGRWGNGLSFNSHRELDRGLAAMAAAMPRFLAFQDKPEKRLFLIQGALSTAALELTRLSESGIATKNQRRPLAS